MRRITPFLLILSLYCLFTTDSYAQCIVVNSSAIYDEKFETSDGNWVAGGTLSDWVWGHPAKSIITGAAQGQNCWITGGLTGNVYNAGQRSFLVSPCFNFSLLTDPYIEFDIFWEQEFRYDGASFQYSIDNGISWLNVGSLGEPVNCLNNNWFNYGNILNMTGLGPNKEGWSGTIKPSSGSCSGGNGSGAWVKATHSLTALAGKANVKFRVTFGAGTTCNTYDGFAVDNIKISNATSPNVDFTFSCINNRQVSFTNTSPLCFNAFHWDFGDPASGAANTATSYNAAHTFSAPGKYDVVLTASGGGGPMISVAKTIYIMDVNATALNVITCANDNNASATAIVTADTGIHGIAYSWNTTPISNFATISGLGQGTYIVTVTANNACTAMDTVVITNPLALSHNLLKTDATCGNANGFIGITPNGGYKPYTYLWSPLVSSIASANNLMPGNYFVKIIDSAGCKDSVVISLVNNGGVSVAISNKINVKCFGGNTGSATANVTGTGGPYTYNWLPTGGNAATANNLTAGLYQVIVNDASGCTDTATVQINEPLTALAASVKAYVAFCGLNNGAARVFVSGGVGPYVYNWTPGNFTTDSINNLLPGNYNVTITDANGCIITKQVVITAGTFPQINSISPTNIACFGQQTGGANANVSGGVPPYTFNWNNGSTTFMGNPLQNVLSGTYQLSVKDANGCISSVQSVIITQPLKPLQHNVTVNNITCANVSGSAVINETGGTLPYVYSWSPYGGNAASATGLNVGSYLVTILDNNNCKDTIQIKIVNTSTVKVTVINITPVTCFGGSNGAATAIATGVSPFTYVWSPTGGSNATSTTLSVGGYQVKVTDNTGCIGIDSVQITGPTQITSVITTTPTTCNNSNGAATITASGGVAPYSYVWSPGSYVGSSVSNLSAGRYTVTITDAKGCASTSQAIVDPSSSPSLSFNIKHTTCNLNNGSIAANVSGGVSPYNYYWSPVGLTTPVLNNLASGNYSLQVTDFKGCTVSSIVFVNPSTVPVVTGFTTTDSKCYGQPGATVAANVTDGVLPYSYRWTNGSDTFTTTALQNVKAGKYTLQVTDFNGCKNMRDTIVGEASAILINVTTATTTCGLQNGAAWLNVSGGTAPYKYLWSSGGNGDTVRNLESGSVAVSVTDANGCVQTSGIEPVAISYPLKISLGNDTIICPGNKVILNPGKFTSYLWQDGSNDSVFVASLTGKYKVDIVDLIGCKATASIKIEATCRDIVFPDAFTPNRDTHNDEFGPLGTLSAVSDYSFKVFNRLGQAVFVSTNPYKKWNGTINGVASDNGVYVWVAQYSFDRRPIRTVKGTIVLIR